MVHQAGRRRRGERLLLCAAVAGLLSSAGCSDDEWALPDSDDPDVATLEAPLAETVEGSIVGMGEVRCDVRLLGAQSAAEEQPEPTHDPELGASAFLGASEYYVWADCEQVDGPSAFSVPMVVDELGTHQPEPGSGYPASVRELFPAALAERILDDPDSLRP